MGLKGRYEAGECINVNSAHCTSDEEKPNIELRGLRYKRDANEMM